MLDSLKSKIDTVQTIDSIELLNKVDSFYNSAWDKLIIMGSISFGIIGIVVPLIIQWYQKQNDKIKMEYLQESIDQKIEGVKLLLNEDLKKNITSITEQLEQKIKKFSVHHNAKAFHIQANNSFDRNDFKESLADFIVASSNYLTSEDYMNLRNTLNGVQSCIKHINQEDIDELKIMSNTNIDNLLNDINQKDEKDVFFSIVKDIRVSLTKLSSKDTSKKNPSS